MHWTIEQMIRAFLMQTPKCKWPDALAYVEFAINSTINVSTDNAPFEMAYGTNVALPIDHALHMRVPELDAAAPDFLSHIRHTILEVKEVLAKAQEYQKAYYNKHHKPTQYSVGDHILLSTRNLH